MPLRTSEDENTKLDPAQSDYNRRFNNIAKGEESGTFDDIVNNYDQTADDSEENSNIKKVKDKEENPTQPNTEPSDFVNNFTGSNNKGGSANVRFKFTRKIAPTGGVIGIITGIGMLMLSFTPATLMINLKENLVQKFDLQNTSMNIRTNKLIANKLAGDTTSGSCSFVKIACRFNRPSNRLLKQLSANGIVAKDASGNPIDINKWLPNTRPTSYSFTNNSGKTVDVEAKDFAKTLASDDEFRSAFHKAYNPRFVGYADQIYGKVMAKFGFNKNSKIASDTDVNKAKKAINVDTSSPNAVSDAAAAGTSADDAAKKLISDEIAVEAKDLEGRIGGKTDAVQISAMLGCFALDVPGIVSKTVRAYQFEQLVRYGAQFLSLVEAIQLGNATPQAAEALGSTLTSKIKDSNGNIISNSAMDSFNVKNALFGDTKTTGYKSDFTKFQPGGSVASKLGSIASVTSSAPIKTVCAAIGTPEATAAMTALEASLAPETLGLSAILLKGVGALAGAVAAQGVISAAISAVTPTILNLIPINSILNFFMGDLTKNLQGEDVGNAIVSGSANLMSETANAGGNMPLTVPQAVAYQKTTDQVNLAYSKEDQATLSPFDASSPNTFLGSIATRMLPYFSELSSVSGSLSFIGSMVSGSISRISGNAYAASTANAQDQFNLCKDSSITNAGIAAGPSCEIYYGIPVQYLNEDPTTVLNSLLSQNQIDSDTGDPIPGSDLEKWMNTCTTGSTIGISECVVNNQTKAEYSLYTVDHRIQISMDEPLTTDTSSTTSTTSTTSTAPSTQIIGAPDNVTAKGSGWTLKDNVDYSATSCAPGTTDAGTYTHPTQGFIIRKCAIGTAFIASVISQKVVDMFNAAKAAGVNLSLSSGFRSYEKQQQLFNQNCNQVSGACSPPTAPPGNSQHEDGIALDIEYNGSTICYKQTAANCHGNAGFDWLTANAKTYGFYNLPAEAWHWSVSGT